MNTTPTQPANATAGTGAAAVSATPGAATDAFALLFGTTQSVPAAIQAGPQADPLAEAEPSSALGIDLSGWLQQLPLTPLAAPALPAGTDAPAPAPGKAAPTAGLAALSTLPAMPTAIDTVAAAAQQALAGRSADALATAADPALLSSARAPSDSAAALPASLVLAAAIRTAANPAPAAPTVPGSAPAAHLAATTQPALSPVAANPAAVRPELSLLPAVNEPIQAMPRLGEAVTAALLQRTEQRGGPADPRAAASQLASSPAEALEVALPPGSAPKIDRAFAEGMAIRLQWMSQQQIGRVEIQLDPEDLGSIDVQIEFEGKAIRAEFQSPIGEVRHLLESSLPRLRELLEAQGLQLQHADVGSGQGRQDSGRHDGSQQGAAAPRPAQQEARPAAAMRGSQHGGQLSEYA